MTQRFPFGSQQRPDVVVPNTRGGSGRADLGPAAPRRSSTSGLVCPGARYRVLGLLVHERFDGVSDAGRIHDVGKVVLARDRVLGHVHHSLP